MPKVLDNPKEDILRVAREMIVNNREYKINMRELANQCGISVGTIYNYFDSKQEIIIYIIETDWKTTIRNIDNINKTEDESMKKLEVIFNELRNFMNHVQNIRYEYYFDKLELDRIKEEHKNKYNFTEELIEKTYEALQFGNLQNDKLTYEILIKLFVSYSNNLNINFSDLKPYIQKLIN